MTPCTRNLPILPVDLNDLGPTVGCEEALNLIYILRMYHKDVKGKFAFTSFILCPDAQNKWSYLQATCTVPYVLSVTTLLSTPHLAMQK